MQYFRRLNRWLTLARVWYYQVGNPEDIDFSGGEYSGALIQYPNTYGTVKDPTAFVKKAHAVSTSSLDPLDRLRTSICEDSFGEGVHRQSPRGLSTGEHRARLSP